MEKTPRPRVFARHVSSRRLFAAAIIAALTPCFADAAHATDFTWKSDASGNWGAAGNWTPDGGPPGASDAAFITFGGHYTVTVDANITITRLTLGGSGGLQTLSIPVNRTLTLNGPAASSIGANGIVNLSGTLAGDSDLTVGGTFNWSAGTIGGGGAFTVNSSLNLTSTGRKLLDGRTITSNGTTNWSGGAFSFGSGATFQNQVGATFRLLGDNTMQQDVGADGSFTNAGTLVKSGTAGTSAIGTFGGPLFTNTGTGTVGVESGRLQFNAGSTQNGTVNVTAGNFLRFASGTHTIDGAAFAGTGSVEIAGGTVNVSGTGTTIGPGMTLSLESGMLGGSGPVVMNGTMDWSGGTIAGTGAFTMNGLLNLTGTASKSLDGRTIASNGTTNWSGGNLLFNNAAAFQNQATAIFDIGGDNAMQQSVGAFGSFANAGTLTKHTTAGTTTIGNFGSPTFTNKRMVRVESGTLRFAAGYTQTAGTTHLDGGSLRFDQTAVIKGGALAGTGTVTGNVDNSGGAVAPGLSPGLLSITGNYAQGAAGTFEVEIAGAGSQFDQLAVSGNATLDGTLAVTSTDGFTPSLGQSFQVMTFASRAGDFAIVTGTEIGEGLLLEKNASVTDVTLSVAQGMESTPTETPNTTPTETPANTPNSTSSASPTPTVTATPTATLTTAATQTDTPTPGDTPTLTPAETPADTPTPTASDGPTSTPTQTETITETTTSTRTPTATPTETPTDASIPCDGDCDADGRVTVAELVVGVNVVLGAARFEDCAALDVDQSGNLTIDELIGAVNNALAGCPA